MKLFPFKTFSFKFTFGLPYPPPPHLQAFFVLVVFIYINFYCGFWYLHNLFEINSHHILYNNSVNYLSIFKSLHKEHYFPIANNICLVKQRPSAAVLKQ